MKIVKVVGPSDSGKTTVVERLADRLSSRGRVGTVKHLRCAPDVDTAGTDTARHRAAGAAETFGVQDDGRWFATGTGRDLGSILAEVHTRCDFVVVEGYSSVRLPAVALGGRPHAGETLVAAADAESVDLDEVVAAIETLEPVGADGGLAPVTSADE